MTLSAYRARRDLDFVICDEDGQPIGWPTLVQRSEVAPQGNGPSNASISINTQDPICEHITAALTRLKVYRVPRPEEKALDPSAMSELIFYGILWPDPGAIRRYSDASNGQTYWDLTFFDPLNLATVRAATQKQHFKDQAVHNIIADLIEQQEARTGGAMFMTMSPGNSSPNRTITVESGDTLADIITGAGSETLDAEVWCEPYDGWTEDGSRQMGILHVKAKRGERLESIAFTSGQGLQAGAGDIELVQRKLVTVARVSGMDANADIHTATETSDKVSIYGIWEETESPPEDTTDDRVQRRAAGTIAKYGHLHSQMQWRDIGPEGPEPFRDFLPGDTVQVAWRDGSRYTEQWARVSGLTGSVDTDGVLRWSVDINTGEEMLTSWSSGSLLSSINSSVSSSGGSTVGGLRRHAKKMEKIPSGTWAHTIVAFEPGDIFQCVPRKGRCVRATLFSDSIGEIQLNIFENESLRATLTLNDDNKWHDLNFSIMKGSLLRIHVVSISMPPLGVVLDCTTHADDNGN